MTKTNQKFFLKCLECGCEVPDMKAWFQAGQKCPECAANRADVIYYDYSSIREKIKDKTCRGSLWFYSEILPLLDEKNIVSFGEGIVPIDRLTSLEKIAKDYFQIDCKVYGHRQDLNWGTGTFKDLAGTVVASVMKEIDEKHYVVSSTGNTANSYSKYCSAAGIHVYVFIPGFIAHSQESAISAYGEHVFRVLGDYYKAKMTAKEFSEKRGYPLASGNFDPMRVEAKKVMVYEWLRLMNDFPTVYIQGLSGGTGPLGIQKALKELLEIGIEIELPRQIMVQPDRCAPMAIAWAKAKKAGFPEGWVNQLEIIENPETTIVTLSAGNPKTYPVLGPFVRETGGEIIQFNEDLVVDVMRFVSRNEKILMGPAAAVPMGGFLKSLHQKLIRNGDVVLVNIGEGMTRAPEFLEQLLRKSIQIRNAAEVPENPVSYTEKETKTLMERIAKDG